MMIYNWSYQTIIFHDARMQKPRYAKHCVTGLFYGLKLYCLILKLQTNSDFSGEE